MVPFNPQQPWRVRKQLCQNALQILTRPFYYAIIDEVDSILIDDCRNPLRITSTARMPLWRFRIAAEVRTCTLCSLYII